MVGPWPVARGWALAYRSWLGLRWAARPRPFARGWAIAGRLGVGLPLGSWASACCWVVGPPLGGWAAAWLSIIIIKKIFHL